MAFWIYIAGLTVSYLAIVFAALAIRATAVHRYHRSVQPRVVPPVTRPVPLQVPSAASEREPVPAGNGHARA